MDQKLPVISDTLKHTRDLTERKKKKEIFSSILKTPDSHSCNPEASTFSLETWLHRRWTEWRETQGQLLSGYKVATQHMKRHRCELRYDCILHRLRQMDWLGNGSTTVTASELHSQNKGKTEGKKLIQWHYPKAYAPCNPGTFGDSLPTPVGWELYSECQYSSIPCAVSDISQRHSIS